MADPKKKLPYNIAGEFFVDSTCINCDACRQLAPEVFDEADEFSFVRFQPDNDETLRRATRALLACPTGSIGTLGENQSRVIMHDFPMRIEEGLYYCGFNSPKSYGGNSYVLEHRDGNWLIDSPKYLPHLIRRFEELGGLRYIFLTHRDDVAEAEKYARYFEAERIIHEHERSSQPGAEIVITGEAAIDFSPGFVIIPTIGHTRGHCVLLYDQRYLFSGDHLWWSRKKKTLSASEDVCWYSWPDQTASMEKLLRYRFEWVLPGHGERVHLPSAEMHSHLTNLVQKMKSSLTPDDLESW